MIALWPLHLLWPFNDHDFVLSWTSDFDYVVLAVVIVATGVSETDGFQHRAPGIIAGAVLLYEHGRCISFYLVKGQDVSFTFHLVYARHNTTHMQYFSR